MKTKFWWILGISFVLLILILVYYFYRENIRHKQELSSLEKTLQGYQDADGIDQLKITSYFWQDFQAPIEKESKFVQIEKNQDITLENDTRPLKFKVDDSDSDSVLITVAAKEDEGTENQYCYYEASPGTPAIDLEIAKGETIIFSSCTDESGFEYKLEY